METHHVCPSWLEVSGTIFSVLGAVGTLGRLYPSDRGSSSMSAYFDPWHHPVTATVLLGVGYGLSLLAEVQENTVMGARLRRIGSVSLIVAAVVVVAVPVIIWIVEVVSRSGNGNPFSVEPAVPLDKRSRDRQSS